MTAEQLSTAGIGEDMIRMSVGLEDFDDLADDLKRALRASQRG
jgi:O-acetylhomoserine (thiol)-lyase